MALPLIPTKISVPSPSHKRLERPRLQRLLEEALERPLTMFSAPAGFGKTTAVLNWLQTVQRPVAWLSLDEGDADLRRFWRYLAASLAQTLPSLAGIPDLHGGESVTTDPRSLAAVIIAALAASETEAILVLEDYHTVIQSGAGSKLIHESLNYFLDYLPPGLHVAILTRSDPPLKLARRRVQGQINEIRAADLRFSRQEAAALFNTILALDLPPAEINALAARTEGWAAGLQLAALALKSSSWRDAPSRRRDFIKTLAGSNHYIADYLLQEVLQRQPADVARFLLQTSILTRFNAGLCAALTETPQAGAMLDRLEEENLFIIPLDSQRRWFRYHHLFRDLLQERLRRQYGAERAAALHRRAAHWYESHGYLSEAIGHALAVEAFAQAAALLEAHAFALIFRRTETNAVARWLDALPRTMVGERPLLCLIAAWLDLLQMRPLAEVEGRLAEVEQAMAREKTGQVVRGHIEAHSGALRAFLARVYRLNFAEAVTYSQQALQAVSEAETGLRAIIWDNLTQVYLAQGKIEAAEKGIGELRQLGLDSDYYITVLTADFLEALLVRCQGKLAQAEAICRRALQRAAGPAPRRQRPLPYAGAVYAVLGAVLYQWNRLEEAASALEKGSELLALTGEHGIYVFALVELARLRHAQGNEEETLALLKKANEHLPSRYLSSQYPAALARSLALPSPIQSEEAIDFKWTEEIEALAVGTAIVRAGNLRGLFYYATATSQMRALIRRRRQGEPVEAGQWRQLQQRIEQWSQDATKSGWTERLIELSLLGALAHAATGAVENALVALQKALQLAKPAGYIRLFVDEGPAVAALLYRAAERGIEAEYAGELLSHFPLPADGNETAAPGAASGLVEPLSQRELEVLAHIAEGMTNQEIAVELKIALSTVKAHARNIYGKLNVGNRTEAVARARELGLSL